MASVTYYGPKTVTQSQQTVTNVWHDNPGSTSNRCVLSGGGTLTASRNGSTISGSITGAWQGKGPSSYYSYTTIVRVCANGEVVKSEYAPSGAVWSDFSFSFSFNNNNRVVLTVEYICGQTGGCQQVNYKPMEGSITIEAYNPWTDPTNLKNVSVTPASIKPEGNVTVSWTKAQAGTGNSISKYQVQFKDSADSSWVTYSDSISSSSSSVTFQPLSYRAKIKPGETLSFRVRAYCSSSTSGHDSYWMGWVSAGNTVSVYKDGTIKYKTGSGQVKEVTKGYYKDSSGQIKKLRYVKVKDGNGAIHVIDVYTTHYE